METIYAYTNALILLGIIIYGVKSIVKQIFK